MQNKTLSSREIGASVLALQNCLERSMVKRDLGKILEIHSRVGLGLLALDFSSVTRDQIKQLRALAPFS